MICDITVYADYATLYSTCDQGIWSVAATSIGFWTWIWSTRHCGLRKKWDVDFNTGKTELVSFEQFNNTGTIDVQMDGSNLEKKSSFMIFGLTFSSKLDWGLTSSLLQKLPLRELEP